MEEILALFRSLLRALASLYPAALAVSGVLAAVVGFFGIHNTVYCILGFFVTRRFRPAQNKHRYAIVIPARNEEKVIGNLLHSIQAQDYPQELLTVFVVADNCTDGTARVARQWGAVCYERFNAQERTKGFALQFLFDRIARDFGIATFEGYFIFDADNLLKADYISRMNDAFDEGEKIITSYRNTKNWNESWIASTYALHWLRSIRWNHRARSFLHLATNIQGTGFLFANEIVKDGWKYTSLTEDRALTADCVVRGYEITYNDAAEFYDEQPVSLKVALRQRLRWSKGHLMAFAENGWGLLRGIFVAPQTYRAGDRKGQRFWREIRHRFMAFDTLAQLMPKNVIHLARWLVTNLLLYPLVCWQTGIDHLQLLPDSTALGRIFRKFAGDLTLSAPPGVRAYVLCVLAVLWLRLFYRFCRYLINIPVAAYLLIVERRRLVPIPLWRKCLYCLTWPTFDIIGRYTQYVALFVKVSWKPIPHESKVTIDDIQVGVR